MYNRTTIKTHEQALPVSLTEKNTKKKICDNRTTNKHSLENKNAYTPEKSIH